MTTEERLRAFILDGLGYDVPREELTDSYALIEKGVLDSIAIFQMVSFVEREFGVEIQDEELVEENFGTIRDLARMIDGKRSAATGS